MSQSANVVHTTSLNHQFHQPCSPALPLRYRLLHASHRRIAGFPGKRVFPGVWEDGFSKSNVPCGPAKCTGCGLQETETNVWQSGQLDLHVQTLRKFPREKLKGETVLVRFDSNILLSPHACRSKHSYRSVYTIRYLHSTGAKVLLVSHWDWKDNLSLLESSVTDHLSSLLKLKVVATNVSSASRHDKKVVEKADIFILENLTQFKEEFSNCPNFAKMLSSDVGIFVNDAFSQSHKVLASTVGVARFCYTSLAGFHFEEELNYLIRTVETTRQPYIAVIGGGNLLEKEAALRLLASKCDGLIFVGKLAFQVMHALGVPVQQRLVEFSERHSVQKVLRLIELARNRHIPILTPMDFLCVNDYAPHMMDIFPASEIRTGWSPVDLGPTSLKEISSLLSACKKILWVGPMKLCEQTRNTSGASELASLIVGLSRSGCDVTVVGSAACSMVEKTGGSISCKYFDSASAVWGFLKGRTLPGVAALDREFRGMVDKYINCDIGEGRNVSFWHDCWLEEDKTIAENFPTLLKLVTTPDSIVAESRQWDVAGWAWKLQFHRDLREHEVGELVELLKKLQKVKDETHRSLEKHASQAPPSPNPPIHSPSKFENALERSHIEYSEHENAFSNFEIPRCSWPTSGNFEAYPSDLDWVSIFCDQTQPLVVDIGSGNGIFLLEMARRWSTLNFLGLEINEKLVNRCLEDVFRTGLHNAHFISTNATHNFRPIISSYPGKLVIVSIQCPNPDFNKEEHRWRMVQRILVEAIIDLLAINGKVFLQSDVKEVLTRMRDQFVLYGKHILVVEGDDGEWIKENPFGISSDWEKHVLERGAPMYRLMMQKIGRKYQNKE